MTESTFVKGVTEKTEAEDRESKSITGSERVAIEETGEGLVVVFLASDDAENISALLLYRQLYDRVPPEITHFQNVGLNAMARAETVS